MTTDQLQCCEAVLVKPQGQDNLGNLKEEDLVLSLVIPLKLGASLTLFLKQLHWYMRCT